LFWRQCNFITIFHKFPGRVNWTKNLFHL
jgi:hypothetical protein